MAAPLKAIYVAVLAHDEAHARRIANYLDSQTPAEIIDSNAEIMYGEIRDSKFHEVPAYDEEKS